MSAVPETIPVRVTVNGQVAELGQKVTAADDIRLDGRPIKVRAAAARQVFLFNRSPGDPLRESTAERQALIERLPKGAGRRFIAVSPMPNVDGGLELVTSDGALATRMQRTIHRLPSEFTVRVKGMLGPDQLNGIRSGKLVRGSCSGLLQLGPQFVIELFQFTGVGDAGEQLGDLVCEQFRCSEVFFCHG